MKPKKTTIGYWMTQHTLTALGHAERYTLARPIRDLGHIECSKISSKDLADYRNVRMGEVGQETVRRELRAVRRALTIARSEHEAPLPSIRELFEKVRLPPMAAPRERRLSAEEEAALFDAAWLPLRCAMTVALETGMRRRELCSVTWPMVDRKRGTIKLTPEITKTKRGRVVPLSPAAREAVELAERANPGSKTVFGMNTNALNLAWQRTRRKAAEMVPSVASYRWHDFRHECLSRLAERGWGVLEIQAVSGHSTPAMLSRYVNLRPDDLVERLNREAYTYAQQDSRASRASRDDTI